MPLIKNQSYEWADILGNTGTANIPPYYLLRARGGRTVLAASLDIATNPRAPYEIWAGSGTQIKQWANALCRQTAPVAVFVRETDGKHYYRGRFQRVDSTADAHEIALRAAQNNRQDIYKILFLQEFPA